MTGRLAMAYAIVSGLCLGLHNSILIVADFVGLSLIFAVTCSYCCVVVMGYFLHSRFSYRKEASLAGFNRYAIAMSGSIPLAFVTTWIWRDLAELPMALAAPLATLSMVFFNFALSYWAIGRKSLGKIV